MKKIKKILFIPLELLLAIVIHELGHIIPLYLFGGRVTGVVIEFFILHFDATLPFYLPLICFIIMIGGFLTNLTTFLFTFERNISFSILNFLCAICSMLGSDGIIFRTVN